MFNRSITSARLIVLSAVFFIAFGNRAFFANVVAVYPLTPANLPFLFSLVMVLLGTLILLLSLLCYRYTLKPILMTLFMVSAFASYFMDSYNTIIDDAMIQNIVSTDGPELLDMLSIKLCLYVIFLGLLPSGLIYKAQLVLEATPRALVSRLKLFTFTLLSIVGVALIFGDFYASFLREHKVLRYYANPSTYIYSTIKYIKGNIKWTPIPLKTIGLDARIRGENHRPSLVIFVVGETARADRFSLAGYERETNPLLKKEQVVAFSNFWSCGTSTDISVPCMFSIYDSTNYDRDSIQSTENVLDLVQRAGVNVLWLDNNSDSKGVALRIPHQNYRSSALNPVCDLECRDVGMLARLQDYVDEHAEGSILIVLHQMGNHGPAYYKRYPPEFEQFTPVCKTNQLEDCSREAINNAYDNAILYTDYFLSETIQFLKQNDNAFKTALFYVSDHGESLGENNLYLHGLPNFFAPDTQRHVPALLWFGRHFNEIDTQSLAMKVNNRYTHGNVFHTILGLLNIETSVYDQRLDLLNVMDGQRGHS